MRAGDTVLHGPTGETWVLAYADGAFVSWCGWPEGTAHAVSCELVSACSDAEHRAMLETWAAKGGNDHRGAVCRRQLAELNRAYLGAYI